MKLLYCKECKSIFNLEMFEKKCVCEKTSGIYVDNLNVLYSGPCIPLGFNNHSFYPALRNQPVSGMGSNFDAFVIPVKCPTMKKTDE